MKNNSAELLESMQVMLIARATGKDIADHQEYGEVRRMLMEDTAIASLLPRFVRTCRSLDQFWAFIQPKYGSYAERRKYIYAEFQPALDLAEDRNRAPSDDTATDVIKTFDADGVNVVWQKALSRRTTDPEGAITLARTLLESVCKHILDQCGVVYDDTIKLPKLYAKTAEQLNLSPTQHTENIFRQILHGCSSVVEGLGALRNKHSDSHGVGTFAARPSPRHAQLAVNLAGAMATFLIETWMFRRPDGLVD